MPHAIFVAGGRIPVVIQPESSTYRPSKGDHSWQVREVPVGYVPSEFVNPSRFPLVESYTPPRAERSEVQTRWQGSWAQQMQEKRNDETR